MVGTIEGAREMVLGGGTLKKSREATLLVLTVVLGVGVDSEEGDDGGEERSATDCMGTSGRLILEGTELGGVR